MKLSIPSREGVPAQLQHFIDSFERERRPQEISFRSLVPWIRMGERATHHLHTYPAKLLPQIAHYFLCADQLSQKGDFVLDPFSGTGTVALETLIAERQPIVSELNPLALLITKAKVQALDLAAIGKAIERIKQCRSVYLRAGASSIPSVVNREYWYEPGIVLELAALKRAIDHEDNSPVKDFLLVSFSHACRKTSRTDPRLSVPVRVKNYMPPPPLTSWRIFDEQVLANVNRYKRLQEEMAGKKWPKVQLAGVDARNLRVVDSRSRGNSLTEPLPSASVQLIITSPPYAGAQKYIRASSLSLGWLGLAGSQDLKPLENASIGREHFRKEESDVLQNVGLVAADEFIAKIFEINRTRSRIVSTYLVEMRAVLSELFRVLKPGGHLVLVVGDNQVCSYPFRSSEYLRAIAESLGFVTRLLLVDLIRSRSLMTKRNKTAAVIHCEWVILLQKQDLQSSPLSRPQGRSNAGY